MQTATSTLTLFLILLSYSGRSNGLCTLENGTVARCHELEDVKYIETYDLESLKASVAERVLHPGFFRNLSSLRHLDLSGGNLERIKPGSFRRLVNLRSLNLAENRIGYLDLGTIDDLNYLHSLNLRKNNFRHLPPTLARLKVLKHLDLQGNPLECTCATLRVRDLIVKRGVKVSKKILCAGPSNMKGTPLFKPDATIICNFEEQDREMQRDQAREGSEEEYGSGFVLDKHEEEEDEEQEVETPFPEPAETPFPSPVETSTTTSEKPTLPDTILVTSKEVTWVTEGASSTQVSDSIPRAIDKEEEFFVDSEEKKEQTSTVAGVERQKVYKDALFYPVEGSGDGDEGSGEGSGTGVLFGNWKKVEEVENADEKEEKEPDNKESLGDKLIDSIFNIFWSSTEASETKKDLDLEDEQFIDASSTKEADEKTIVTKKINLDEATPNITEATTKTAPAASTNTVELVGSEASDMSKMGKVKAEEDINNELAEVSPAKQSKKGMGSYVVLAALLAILATLIGFAAYKGDFCKKKRKRGDAEGGTELKDMQKALLDTGNATQPKIAANGNVENAPLVEDAIDHEERRPLDDDQGLLDVCKPSNGTTDRADPVKPPRRAASPQDDRMASEGVEQDAGSAKENSLSGRTSFVDPSVNNGPMGQEVSGPPLSPGAQRVKITLQENPDSVPRTPILITRTMAGENLVKKP